GLENGTTYYYVITTAMPALDANNKPIVLESPVTGASQIAVVPEAKVPAVPTSLSAARGDQLVSLSWKKDSSGVAGVTYTVYYSTTPATDAAALKAATTTEKVTGITSSSSYNHTGLTQGKTYYYVVTATGEGESAPSNIVAVTL